MKAGEAYPTIWKAPSEGWLKVNTDAGELRAFGSGVGVVCRDSNGKLVGCAAIHSSSRWEMRVAEAKAV